MVIYDLMCDAEHRFEGWFKSADDYQQQRERGLLSCPMCSSEAVRKIPSASYVQTARSKEPAAAKESHTGGVVPTVDPKVMQKIREFVESHTDDVGQQFAEEARKMHYGETEHRPIRGEASLDEVVELHQEGIDALPVPLSPRDPKKLN